MSVVSVFEDIGGWFKKVFKSSPKWEVAAISSINVVAPEAELLLAILDPEAAAVATPIITEIQADLGTVANLLKSGNTVNLSTFLAAIKFNLAALLSEAHITNPDSVKKATGIIAAITGVITSIERQLGLATA